MAKFHDSGTICTAHVKACPLGLSDGEHIDANSVQEFEAKLYEKMSADGDVFSTADKNTDSVEARSNQVAPVKREPTVERYVHPQGKVVEVDSQGNVTTYKDGKIATTSATVDKLRAGYGAWKRDDAPSGAPLDKNRAVRPTAKSSTSEKSNVGKSSATTAVSAESSKVLSAAEKEALVDSYDQSVADRKQKRQELDRVMKSHVLYNSEHAEAEGRMSYVVYSNGYRETKMGKNPDPKGYTSTKPSEDQERQQEEAFQNYRKAVEAEADSQTSIEKAGLGHRIPDKGNTIRVRTQAQKWLLKDELQGQISDGQWENTANNPYQDWSNAKVIVDPKNPGRNFNTTKDNYQLNSKSLLSVVGDRMKENVSTKTEKSYSDKEMANDLKDLRTIFKTKRNQVTGD